MFAVHILTGLGAGVALLALLEAVREHWAAMFGWLGLALVIDAIDGPSRAALMSSARCRTGRARCSTSWLTS